jgi:protein phosphatase
MHAHAERGQLEGGRVTPFAGAVEAPTARGAFVASSVRLQAAAASQAGPGHGMNEDCHSPLDGIAPVFIVADGVGGGAFAAHASRELVTLLHAALEHDRPDAERVRNAVLAADRTIERNIARSTDAAGAATFALCAATGHSLRQWLVAWVGDCRVYRVPAGRREDAQLVTADDTYRALSEAPPAGSLPDDPARMVGNGAVDLPNVTGLAVATGDILVLCSDGVHKHVGAGDLARLVRGAGTLADRCARIVETARSNGSRDDATVLLVRRAAARYSTTVQP